MSTEDSKTTGDAGDVPSDRPGERRGLGDESGIIVFGGGGRGCTTRGCLFWIILSVVLSVGLTILVNLILLLFSGPGGGVSA